MPSCRECRWWTRELKWLSPGEGVCMIARTEPSDDGTCRPVVSATPMRAVANGGDIAASLITVGDFECRQFAPR